MNRPGKVLILFGVVLIAVGALMLLLEKGGLRLFHLPGDIVYRKGNVTIFFPIVSCVIISILLMLLFRFLNR